MPRPRFFKLPLERQHQIILAAAKELATYGYERSSLNRILAQTGLSKGAAYYYFDSKEDLVATVFLTIWQRMQDSTQLDLLTLTPENYWTSIFGLIRNFMDSAKDDPWLLSAAKAIWGLPPAVRTSGPLAKAFQTTAAWLANALKRGRDLGVVRSDIPEALLLSIALAMDEAFDRWVFENCDSLDQAELARLSEVMFQLWRRVLSPPPSEAS